MNDQAVTVSHLIFLMDQHGSRHQRVSSKVLVDASLAPLKRSFERRIFALHNRLPFSTAKTAHSLSTVFEGSIYDRKDQQRVIVEFEPDGGKSCPIITDKLKERLHDDIHESVATYLVVCGVMGQNVGSGCSRNRQMARFVSIADVVEELCESSFRVCESLSRVTFGESCSLERIGKEVFYGSGVREIHIPDSVEELCEGRFYACHSLSRVTFGESSSLKLIGKWAFR